MASYVVDASVICQYFITQMYTVEARVVVGQMLRGDQLYIPEFTLLECTNVFWKEVRFQGLSSTEAEKFTQDLLALPFQLEGVSQLLPQALQVGLAHQLPIYDCPYITLAMDLNCSLVTVDNRQAQSALASGVTLKPITDFTPA